ncbi:MAG TPA: nitrate- and nitrite sensing domain-containing protein, partial [Pseudonocardiaceae bacterium]
MTPVQSLSTRYPTWSALVRWRNWRLPVKLAAVTAVPVLLAVALGAQTVHSQVERAALFERSDRLVAVGDSVLRLVSALHDEREATVRRLAGAVTPAAGPDELAAARATVDTALTGFRTVNARLTRAGESIGARLDAATRQLADLPRLRDRVSAGLGLQPVAAMDEYGTVVDRLLDVHRALASDIADAGHARAATALHDLAVTVDQLRLQQALVTVGLAAGSLGASDLDALRAAHVRAVDTVDDFRATAGPAQLEDHRATVAGPEVDAREELLGQVLDLRPGEALPIDGAAWAAASGATIGRTADVATRLGATL